MAAYDSADVTATTLEGAFLQLAQLLQIAEQTYTVPQGETRQNRVQLAINTDTQLATITATIPLVIQNGTAGTITVEADEYTA